ncbi:MAG: carboxypeptidase regulatory-like domain-containing protein, partial [Muribaculaceae bacterium]|nr:carboxypeptidase regulatory-like domain-containing protein [Muribaculaceae bacterium]
MTFTSCTEEPEVTTGSIAGHVTESKNGAEPLSGVTVSILSSGQSTTTGSDGTFKFMDLQPGNYSIQFTKTGYTSTTRNVSVVAGLAVQCDVQLSAIIQEAEIEFNPSSLNFGTTLTDLSVTIKNNGNATAEWSLNLGNNPWLSASELAGSIQAGRTQSIIFSVDRNYLAEPKSVIVNFHAFGNSYPISISCAPRNAKSSMVVEPTELNFGNDVTEKTFTIRNTGNSELAWRASGISTPALTLSS